MTEITVFTPTYNRAYILENLFNSLNRQNFKNFEWIIVDDGSTDGTESLAKQFINSAPEYPIRYIKRPNGGKHRAINTGVSLARGRLFFIVDSDDCLTDDSLETVLNVERSIPLEEKEKFAGVCGLRGKFNLEPLGTTFEGDMKDLTTLERVENGITGDKAEVFYTDVLKRYPFPEFDGEKFLTECVVWDKIAADHLYLRFFNKVIYKCEYLSDGLTKNINAHNQTSPKGMGLYIKQSIEYGKLTGYERWQSYLNYYYLFRDKLSTKEMANNLGVPFVPFYFRLLGMKIFYKIYS